ncbi:unnamed protein product, partial [Rotaria sordida]
LGLLTSLSSFDATIHYDVYSAAYRTTARSTLFR